MILRFGQREIAKEMFYTLKKHIKNGIVKLVILLSQN